MHCWERRATSCDERISRQTRSTNWFIFSVVFTLQVYRMLIISRPHWTPSPIRTFPATSSCSTTIHGPTSSLRYTTGLSLKLRGVQQLRLVHASLHIPAATVSFLRMLLLVECISEVPSSSSAGGIWSRGRLLPANNSVEEEHTSTSSSTLLSSTTTDTQTERKTATSSSGGVHLTLRGGHRIGANYRPSSEAVARTEIRARTRSFGGLWQTVSSTTLERTSRTPGVLWWNCPGSSYAPVPSTQTNEVNTSTTTTTVLGVPASHQQDHTIRHNTLPSEDNAG
jgi:hypothetical protein